MSLSWLNNLIIVCAGSYVGTSLAYWNHNRNQLKLKIMDKKLEELRNENHKIKMPNEFIRQDVKDFVEKISLHYKWLYGKKNGKRLIHPSHNYGMSIQDFYFLLKITKNKYNEYVLKKNGFNYSLDNMLKEIGSIIPQLKDPFGKINDDNKHESLKNDS